MLVRPLTAELMSWTHGIQHVVLMNRVARTSVITTHSVSYKCRGLPLDCVHLADQCLDKTIVTIDASRAGAFGYVVIRGFTQVADNETAYSACKHD